MSKDPIWMPLWWIRCWRRNCTTLSSWHPGSSPTCAACWWTFAKIHQIQTGCCDLADKMDWFSPQLYWQHRVIFNATSSIATYTLSDFLPHYSPSTYMQHPVVRDRERLFNNEEEPEKHKTKEYPYIFIEAKHPANYVLTHNYILSLNWVTPYILISMYFKSPPRNAEKISYWWTCLTSS